MMSWEYIAGFFDGEGHVEKPSRGRHFNCKVTIGQLVRHRGVLDEIVEFLREYGIKAKIYDHPLGERRSPMCYLIITSVVNAEAFLTALLPHLRVKRTDVLASLAVARDRIERERERQHGIETAVRLYLEHQVPIYQAAKQGGVDARTVSVRLRALGWEVPRGGKGRYDRAEPKAIEPTEIKSRMRYLKTSPVPTRHEETTLTISKEVRDSERSS
jgi:intein/homing endonuclease